MIVDEAMFALDRTVRDAVYAVAGTVTSLVVHEFLGDRRRVLDMIGTEVRVAVSLLDPDWGDP